MNSLWFAANVWYLLFFVLAAVILFVAVNGLTPGRGRTAVLGLSGAVAALSLLRIAGVV